MLKRLLNRLLHLETNERKNFSLWMMFGGALVFTLMLSLSFFLVRGELGFIFWLGIAAHAQLALIMSGFIGQLIKRRVKIGRDGLELEDAGVGTQPTIGEETQ